MTEAKIQTPVTIYTNGNGCKWINDAEGEAVDFVTVAAALNRHSELEAEVKVLREANRWIPVSERLPDYDDGQFLVTTKSTFNGETRVEFANDYSTCYKQFSGDYGDHELLNVTAWMPLPKPYQALAAADTRGDDDGK